MTHAGEDAQARAIAAAAIANVHSGGQVEIDLGAIVEAGTADAGGG
jgi:hypothetical protein